MRISFTRRGYLSYVSRCSLCPVRRIGSALIRAGHPGRVAPRAQRPGSAAGRLLPGSPQGSCIRLLPVVTVSRTDIVPRPDCNGRVTLIPGARLGSRKHRRGARQSLTRRHSRCPPSRPQRQPRPSFMIAGRNGRIGAKTARDHEAANSPAPGAPPLTHWMLLFMIANS